MKIVYIVVAIIAGIVLLFFIIGLLLPKERVVTRQSVYPVTPDVLYSIVLNNDDWQYRTGLKNLIIIENNYDYEIWEETTLDGVTIRFTTKEKRPFSFYSFDMDSKMFSGYWTATFEPVNKNETLFTATEYISVKNPIIKVLSYLFFDIEKLMDNYQNDLKNRVEKENP